MAEARVGRERKTVERFVVEEKEEVEFQVPEGKGEKLGTLAFVEESFDKLTRHSEELKKLYHLVFGKVGKLKELKAHLREFSGIVYKGSTEEERDVDKNKVLARGAKWSLPLIKNVIDVLGVDRSAASFEDGKASKDALFNRLIGWLECPEASKKKTKAEKAKKKPAAKKATPTKKTEPKKKTASAKKTTKTTAKTTAKTQATSTKSKAKAKPKAKAAKSKTTVSRSAKPLFSASRYMLSPALQKEQAAKDAKRKASAGKKRKTSSSTASRSSKKQKKAEDDDEDEDDDDADGDEMEEDDAEEEADEQEDEQENEQEEGAEDSEHQKAIRASITRIMEAGDSDLTIKKVRGAVEEELGKSMKEHKDFIKTVVMAKLQ
jgi:hypothetical protein